MQHDVCARAPDATDLWSSPSRWDPASDLSLGMHAASAILRHGSVASSVSDQVPGHHAENGGRFCWHTDQPAQNVAYAGRCHRSGARGHVLVGQDTCVSPSLSLHASLARSQAGSRAGMVCKDSRSSLASTACRRSAAGQAGKGCKVTQNSPCAARHCHHHIGVETSGQEAQT